MGKAFSNIGKAVGMAALDVGTLGQSYSSRQARKMQEKGLDESRRLQAIQDAKLEKIGPAPVLDLPAQEQQDLRKSRRLLALQAGLSSTIKSKPSFGSDIYKPSANGRQTLG